MNQQPPATTPTTTTIEQLMTEAEATLRADPGQAETVIRQLAELDPQVFPAGRAASLIFGGNARVMAGEYAVARPLLEEGLALSTRLEEPGLTVRACNGLGAVHVMAGEFGQALDLHMRGLTLARTLKGEAQSRSGLLTRTLMNIGNLYFALHDHEQALAYHRGALHEAERAQGRTFMPRLNMATNQASLGDLDGALALRRELLTEARRSGSTVEEAFVLSDLADNLFCLRQFAQARDVAQGALTLTGTLGLQLEHGQMLRILGLLEAAEGRPEQGRSLLEQALALGERMPSTPLQLAAHRDLSEVLEAGGDLAGALRHARAYHDLERRELLLIAERRTQMAGTQLKVELLRRQAEEQDRQNAALEAVNQQLRETQERLLYAATHDDLTGLVVRAALEEAMADDLLLAPDRLRALLMIDIDHFKQVNDSLGHPVGDAFLQEIARRLKSAAAPTDDVARRGGDEFTVYLRDLDSPAEAMDRAEQLLRAIARPMTLEGHSLRVTTSIGVAVYPHDGPDVVTLEKHADIALYRAKEKRNQVCRFGNAAGEADAASAQGT